MAEKVNAKKKIDTIILCVAFAIFVISTIIGGVVGCLLCRII